MPALVLFSQRPRAGKTAVAVGLAYCLRQDKRPAALIRLGPADGGSTADARCFASLGLAAGKTAQPLSADEERIRKGRIYKVPVVRMKNVEPAKPAPEFPPFDLQPKGERSGDKICFLQFHFIFRDGNRNIEIEIRIYGCKS